MKEIAHGALAVIPTDTIYGLITSAWNKESVERVYLLKERSPHKPCIILISSAHEMSSFGVSDELIEKVIEHNHHLSPTSFIVPINRSDLYYLDRGTGTLAFRIPKQAWLQTFLKDSGPIIAPSANTEGNPPATTVAQARQYFGDAITYYIDGGILEGNPSTLIDILTGNQLR